MPSLPRIRRARARDTVVPVSAPPSLPAELGAAGLTWINLDAPSLTHAQELADRFGWHPLDVEDVMSKRQRPKVDDYADEGYLFGVLHFPVYDRSIQRLNAAELDVFVGPDYLVTLPGVELLPVTRLFRRCEEDEAFREQLLSKGSGRLLYEVLDDLFDYCFPILDKIGYKLDSLEDDVFEGRSEAVVRDISNVKQEIISYRKIIKPERSTLRLLERRALPARGARSLLRRHRRRRRAHLGHPRQLQGGRRGPRGHERVGDLAPPERRAARADGVLGGAAAADADHRLLRNERALSGLRHRLGVLGHLRRDGRDARRVARVLPAQALAVASGHAEAALGPVATGVRRARRRARPLHLL
jgi:Mg2+ and Co2+ transporter CorA